MRKIIFVILVSFVTLMFSSCMTINYCSDYSRHTVPRYQYYSSGKYSPKKQVVPKVKTDYYRQSILK